MADEKSLIDINEGGCKAEITIWPYDYTYPSYERYIPFTQYPLAILF